MTKTVPPAGAASDGVDRRIGGPRRSPGPASPRSPNNGAARPPSRCRPAGCGRPARGRSVTDRDGGPPAEQHDQSGRHQAADAAGPERLAAAVRRPSTAALPNPTPPAAARRHPRRTGRRRRRCCRWCPSPPSKVRVARRSTSRPRSDQRADGHRAGPTRSADRAHRRVQGSPTAHSARHIAGYYQRHGAQQQPGPRGQGDRRDRPLTGGRHRAARSRTGPPAVTRRSSPLVPASRMTPRPDGTSLRGSAAARRPG